MWVIEPEATFFYYLPTPPSTLIADHITLCVHNNVTHLSEEALQRNDNTPSDTLRVLNYNIIVFIISLFLHEAYRLST